MERYVIGLDWGISSFRAYLMNATEEILDTVANDSGILGVADGSFEEVLEACASDTGCAGIQRRLSSLAG